MTAFHMPENPPPVFYHDLPCFCYATFAAADGAVPPQYSLRGLGSAWHVSIVPW